MEKITEFKEFVREHPGLKERVRNGNTSWQNLYEEWYLYGSDDKQWSPYKKNDEPVSEVVSNEKATTELNGAEMMTQAFEYLQKVDIDKVQKTMGTFQQFIQIFQTMQGGKGMGGSVIRPTSKQNFSGFFSQFDD
jgi:hypothetical protein